MTHTTRKQEHIGPEHELRRLERELEATQARHRVAIYDLRNSVQFKLGEMFTDLRSASGWRVLLPRLWEICSLIRKKRSRKPRITQTLAMPYPNRPDITAATILDEFSAACWGAEFRTLEIERSFTKEQFPDVDFLLVESVWEGPRASWRYMISSGRGDERLDELVTAAKSRSIPTIFWNKEDPTNYDRFISAAKYFDWVFTTDQDCLSEYKKDLGHSNVANLMFAAQPKIHNPIGSGSYDQSSICFAGAWRGGKYPIRAMHLSYLLDAALKTGNLTIFDRELSSGNSQYPARFRSHVRPGVPYGQMLSEYRRYAVFLNTNSVESSPTMLSRRVFELLACGTPVISAPSRAVEETFGDLVPIASTELEATNQLSLIIDDPAHRRKISHLGYRFVHSEHTYSHRFAQIADRVGLEVLAEMPEPTVDWICVSERPAMINNIISNFRRQTYTNRHLTLVLNSDEYDETFVQQNLSEVINSRVIKVPRNKTLGECLNIAISETDADYVAKIDDDDFYGSEYLSDLILATKYSDASILGKKTIHALIQRNQSLYIRNPGHEFCFTDIVAGGTLLAKRADILDLPFQTVQSGTDTAFLRDARNNGLSVFSADRYNYVMCRRIDSNSHTWKISEEKFLRNAVLEKKNASVEDADL